VELASTSQLVECHGAIPFDDDEADDGFRTPRGGGEEDVGALESESILISGRGPPSFLVYCETVRETASLLMAALPPSISCVVLCCVVLCCVVLCCVVLCCVVLCCVVLCCVVLCCFVSCCVASRRIDQSGRYFQKEQLSCPATFYFVFGLALPWRRPLSIPLATFVARPSRLACYFFWST
jgi:hypothetical protein